MNATCSAPMFWEEQAWCDGIADTGDITESNLEEWDYLTATYDHNGAMEEYAMNERLLPTVEGSCCQPTENTPTSQFAHFRTTEKNSAAFDGSLLRPVSGAAEAIAPQVTFYRVHQTHMTSVLESSSGLERLHPSPLAELFAHEEQFISTPRIAELMALPSSFDSFVSEGLSRLSDHGHCTPGAANVRATSDIGYSLVKPHDLQPPSHRHKTVASPAKAMCPPLTAYNYFYRNERDTIVNGMTSPSDPLPESDLDFTPTKKDDLLHQRWNVDPFKKKREHRKTHGRIEFTALSRVIAKRWKMLPEHGRAFYREVANADQKRYDSYLATMRLNNSSRFGKTSLTPI